NGGRPSHPELLDWLATDFVGAQAWSLKRFHRLIMTSATYRRSATHPALAKAQAIDADNRLLWHFAPQRLEAEAVRDAMLGGRGQTAPGGGRPRFPPFPRAGVNLVFLHSVRKDRPQKQPPHRLPHLRAVGQRPVSGIVRLPRTVGQNAAPQRDDHAAAGAGA